MAKKHTAHFERHRRMRVASRPGLTLLEALIASTVLSIIVLSVASAMSAAQQVSFEGQKRILAAIAVDDLMSELITLDYNALKLKDGQVQDPGFMESLDGAEYPESFWAIGRSISVTESDITEPDLGITIRGLDVVVTCEDDDGVVLAVIQMFVPEPA